jgi:hypothetical protein
VRNGNGGKVAAVSLKVIAGMRQIKGVMRRESGGRAGRGAKKTAREEGAVERRSDIVNLCYRNV